MCQNAWVENGENKFLHFSNNFPIVFKNLFSYQLHSLKFFKPNSILLFFNNITFREITKIENVDRRTDGQTDRQTKKHVFSL